MASDAYLRFQKSTEITYEMWHDGEGYDLDAIGEMAPEERVQVESELIQRLSGRGDWRDIDGLAALGTTSAVAAIQKARSHHNHEVRNQAIEYFAAAESVADPEQLDAEIARAVGQGAIDMAVDHRTPAVKRALLDLSRLGNSVQRVNAAAMLLYVCGKTKEPFDWEERPFFLRFNGEGHDLYVVWHELKARAGL